jgi:Zn-dependent M28 family amino/carboxypeptidase
MISKTIRLLIILTMFMGVLAYAPAANADDISETKGFRKAVTLAGIREHQAAFQSFSDDSGGNRASGTAGFDDSAQYVYDRMAAAGYIVSFQEFTFPFVGDNTPPVFQQISPTAKTYVDGVDFGTIQYSGSGDVTAALYAVDLVVPPVGPANGNTSGCEAADFAGFPAGGIALVQRGTCTFRIKAENAVAAGAAAIVIFNEGQPGRTSGAFGTLAPPIFDRPVLSASFAVGDELRNGVLNGPTGVTVRVRTDTLASTRTTRNVIAETPGGDPNRVIVVGAHLDSVTRGPGINDNGSGSATILEVAEVFAQQGRVARNKLRFMWYGAEENGLIGSTFYVDSLSQAERDKIELMLNFDMIGSPNFMRGVYDGDNSAFPPVPGQVQQGPPGSGAIEQLFVDYFNSQGLYNQPTPFSGRSDYGPFIITAGIPAGGLFTGAEGAKTPEEVAIYGGIAGAQYDPCYHLACDTFAGTGSGGGATAPGLGLTALDQMSDAVAHAVLLFSKRNFEQQPLVDPVIPSALASTAATESDSGPHPAHDEAIDR